MSNKLRTYIAAPINGLSYEEAKLRNRRLAGELEALGFEPVDPLDFERADELSGLSGSLDHHAERLGIATPEGIVTNCLALIDSCHRMLIWLADYTKDAPPSTWGTPAEMMYAYLQEIPVVTVTGGYHSAWIDTMTDVQPAGSLWPYALRNPKAPKVRPSAKLYYGG